MSALRIRSGTAYAVLVMLVVAAPARTLHAQVEARAILDGGVQLGDSALRVGTVVLHRVSDIEQGEIDSTRVSNGQFSFTLPGIPNPALGDIYFASVRHQGVMYFGPPITQAIDLDSTYVIQVWDTILAPAEGLDVALQSRVLFFDPQGSSWTITDLFELRNDLDRTVVARPEGHVWTYPLPAAAADVVTGEDEMSEDVIAYDAGSIVVRGALPPGTRMFVVRYTLPSPEVSIPAPGATSTFDVLVREPAPPLEVTPLNPAESAQMESGVTYRRYAGENIADASVEIVLGEEVEPPPVQWIAVILAAILTLGGMLALRARRSTRAAVPAPSNDRQDLLLQVARLDEEYQREASPSEARTREYRARRAALLQRLKNRT